MPVEKIVEVEKVVDRVVEVPVVQDVEVEKAGVDRVVERPVDPAIGDMPLPVEEVSDNDNRPHRGFARPSIGPAGVYGPRKIQRTDHDNDKYLTTNRRSTGIDRPGIDSTRAGSTRRSESEVHRRRGDRRLAGGRKLHSGATYRSELADTRHSKSRSGWLTGPASILGLGRQVGETELNDDLSVSSSPSTRRPDSRALRSGSEDNGTIGIRPSRRRDDLTRIDGISPATLKQLYAINITSFEQLAELSDRQIGRLQKQHFFMQNIRRQNWVGQAARLSRSKTKA